MAKAAADKKKQADDQAKRAAEKKQADEQAKLAAEKKKQADLAAKAKAETEAKRVAEAKRKQEEQQRKEADKARELAQLEKELAQEQQKMAADRASQQLMVSMTDYINSELSRNWRISSAFRDGMEAVVEIRLFPSGEVDSANLVKSSGDSGFDNAAVQAVFKVDRFVRVAEVDPLTFERNLRKFRVKFRPEGLRW